MSLASLAYNRMLLDQTATAHPRGQATLADWYAVQQRGDALNNQMFNYRANRQMQNDANQNRYAMALLQLISDREAMRARSQQQQMSDASAANRLTQQIAGNLRSQELEGQQRRQLAGFDANERRWQSGFNAQQNRDMAQFNADENRWQQQFTADQAMQRLNAGFDQERAMQDVAGSQRLDQMMLQGAQQFDLTKLDGSQRQALQQAEMAERFRQAQAMSTQELMKLRDQEFQQQLDGLSRSSHRFTPQGAQVYGKVRQSLAKLDEAFRGGKGRLTLEEYLGERQKIAQQLAQVPWDSPEYQMPWGEAPGDTREYGNRLYIRNPDGTYKESGPAPTMNTQAEWDQRRVVIRHPDTGQAMGYGVYDYNGNLQPIMDFPQPQAAGQPMGFQFDPQRPLQDQLVPAKNTVTGEDFGYFVPDGKGGLRIEQFPTVSGATRSASGGAAQQNGESQPITHKEWLDYVRQATDILTKEEFDPNMQSMVVKKPDPLAVRNFARELLLDDQQGGMGGNAGMIPGPGPMAEPRMPQAPSGVHRNPMPPQGNVPVLDEQTRAMLGAVVGDPNGMDLDPRTGIPQPSLQNRQSMQLQSQSVPKVGTADYKSLIEFGVQRRNQVLGDMTISENEKTQMISEIDNALRYYAVPVQNAQEARGLPPGTLFYMPDGELRRVD